MKRAMVPELPPTFMSDSTDSASLAFSQDFPLDITERIVHLIHDRPTLVALCLTSKTFVLPVQAKIFSRLDLTKKSSRVIRSLISAPHITWYTRSFIVNHTNPDLPALLGALSNYQQSPAESARVRDFTFTHDYGPWTVTLLRPLVGKILPNLVSLTLDSIDAPIFLVTSCTSLQYLRVYSSVLHVEGDDGFSSLFDQDIKQLGMISPSLESHLMPFLTLLGLDGTRNRNGELCPLVELIQQGKFGALKGLEFPRESRYWFPLDDIAMVMKPLMNRLVCLDVGYWPQWNDLFQIRLYPCLLFFSTRLQ
ncbi:hypothetical protein DL96DRAFT_392862 [Flagelloscypha sp. PMI_526]|nr:hypothetical protein DL96DRAFT_392862 [Flagelloscypha sp. PMI_526]